MHRLGRRRSQFVQPFQLVIPVLPVVTLGLHAERLALLVVPGPGGRSWSVRSWRLTIAGNITLEIDISAATPLSDDEAVWRPRQPASEGSLPSATLPPDDAVEPTSDGQQQRPEDGDAPGRVNVTPCS